MKTDVFYNELKNEGYHIVSGLSMKIKLRL